MTHVGGFTPAEVSASLPAGASTATATATASAVYVPVSADDDALVLALDAAFGRGLPLRLFSTRGITTPDLCRVAALAARAFPSWRWVWSMGRATDGWADLFHVQPAAFAHLDRGAR